MIGQIITSSWGGGKSPPGLQFCLGPLLGWPQVLVREEMLESSEGGQVVQVDQEFHTAVIKKKVYSGKCYQLFDAFYKL